MKLILGSGSPRRKEILESVFGNIDILPPHIDESILPGEKPADYTMRIVNAKMDSVLNNGSGDSIYNTSDTIVTIDNRILGKPESRDDAYSMLRLLSGREHSVITGLCISQVQNGYPWRKSAYEVSSVIFRKLEDDGINKYLDLINYSDKAGSYAVQEYGEMIVDSINGSVTNVIGLPLSLLFRMMGDAGLMMSLL